MASAEAGERAALAAYQRVILNALRRITMRLSGSQKRLEEFTVQRRQVATLREFAACQAAPTGRLRLPRC